MSTRSTKRPRHGATTRRGDTVEDFRNREAKSQAERNLEQRNRAREVSALLRDETKMQEEIEKLKTDKEMDHSKEIALLETQLQKRKDDHSRRLSKQEMDSEVARRRKLKAGYQTGGPSPPSCDPPRRGVGFPPPPPPLSNIFRPEPPPPLENTVPYVPLSVPLVIPHEEVKTVVLPKKPAATMFLPTSVAIQKKKGE